MKTLDIYFDQPDTKRETARPVPEAAAPESPPVPVPTPPPTADAQAERAPPASGGLVIDAVELKGFMRYLERQRVVFSDQFTVITGRTGAGKSSILDAITFAIYGRSTRTDQNVKQEDICRPGGFVTVAFRLGEDRYTITRGVPQQGGGAYLTVDVNGSILRGKLSELEVQLREALGLDYQAFCNSTFIRQDEMRELGASTGAKRLEIFQKLFRLDVFERAQKVCKERLDGVRGELGKLDGQLLEIDAMLGRRGELEREAMEMTGQAAALDAGLPAAEAKAKEMDEKVHRLAAAYQQARPVLEELGRRRAELADLRRKADETCERLKRLEEVKAELAKFEAQDGAAALRQRAEELRLREERHASKNRQLKEHHDLKEGMNRQHRQRLSELEQRLATEQRRLSGLSCGLTHEEAFGLLRLEGGLEERLARIALELDWLSASSVLVAQFKRERGESELKLTEVRGRAAGINADCFAATEIRRNVERLNADLERENDTHRKAVEEAQATILSDESELAGIGFDESARQELLRIEGTLGEAKRREEQVARLRDEAAKLSGAPELLEEYRQRDGELVVLIADVEAKAREFSEQAAGMEEAQKAVRAARQQMDSLRERASMLKGQVKAKRQELERLDEFETKRDELRGCRDQLARRDEVLSHLSERVFHSKGVALFALGQLLAPLSAEASQILAELTENRFSKLWLESKGENRSFGILVKVEGVDAKFHDVAEFSGGERTQINAALRLAIASELARMPQAGRSWCRMRTLIIDEGDLGSLDSELSRGLFVQKLFSLGNFFERVVLITHLGEVAELFGARLNVEMDALGRSRVEVVR